MNIRVILLRLSSVVVVTVTDTCPLLHTAASGSQPASRLMYLHSSSYML